MTTLISIIVSLVFILMTVFASGAIILNVMDKYDPFKVKGKK